MNLISTILVILVVGLIVILCFDVYKIYRDTKNKNYYDTRKLVEDYERKVKKEEDGTQ